MKSNNPILDQPQTIDWDDIVDGATYRLANQDIFFDVDDKTDLCDLTWPWAGEMYAKRITLTVSAPREEALMPMVTRLYPGHQELIMGTEGVIVTKRVAVPLQSDYDRSVIWLLDCQAEGDRLLRLDVEIDWGEPLTQRMVDGLLVAQRNPGPQRGIYSQSNAELTCVFGNPDARPDQIEIESAQHAHLVYHVLVNGMVEVPLLLAISDVGEQMAWNGFLAMRDAERAFELSGKAWEKLLKTGRLWTPDVALNQQIQASKLAAARRVQRVRAGFAATDRLVEHNGALVDLTDTYDVTLSRNLLAPLRRLAEATMGRLPLLLPLRPRDATVDPGSALLTTVCAYLSALQRHLSRHFDAKLLADHYNAVGLCVEQALRQVADDADTGISDNLAIYQRLQQSATTLATWHGVAENAQRWQAAFAPYVDQATTDDGDQATEQAARRETTSASATEDRWWKAPAAATLTRPTDAPWHLADPWIGISWAGRVLWRGCGIGWRNEELWVTPDWPTIWQWWALLDLPYVDERTITLLWDGTTLHATQPIRSVLPTQQWDTIRTRRTDELEFDLYFELQAEVSGETHVLMVHPEFFNNE